MSLVKNRIIRECLPNGISVLLRQMPVQEYLVGLSGKGGSIGNRRESLPDGAAHMLEHVLIRQLSPQTKEKYDINGKTTQTHISIYGHGKSNNKSAELAKELLSAMHHSVSRDSMEKEMPRIENEIKHVQNTASEKHENFVSKVFENTPLASSILGTPETLQKITRNNLQSFLQNTFTAGNTLLVAVGNINPEEILKTAREHPALKNSSQMDGLPSTEPDRVQIKDAFSDQGTYAVQDRVQKTFQKEKNSLHDETSTVLIGYKIPYRKNIKSYASYLAIAHSIEKHSLAAGLNLSPQLYYTDAGGLLFFAIPKNVYKNISIASMVEKAAENIKKDIEQFKHSKPSRITLQQLDLPSYLFSIGLGSLTEEELLSSLKKLETSDITEGLKIFNKKPYIMEVSS
ncbi:hypothetical protein NEMIN01_1323 [Nematocida minor]|uniref:uncharacterized protein n=1 Tax=Nematocida minor TaxID=1912983 RepID=UPI00221FA572|nr:uncharacterized protein NEMIN01_1323 [Nematocida minor]KAI5190990.1 hypothetical protein NEMIN01_1323 [Nematocida minor]